MMGSGTGDEQERSADLIIIGGGIIGGACARDAALRGLRVILVEQHDFGAGTSATSTRLIHGGLRYLEQLDLGLVRQDLAERERLLQLAPHLVHPLPFLIPFYRRGHLFQLKMRAGLILYDLLSFDRSLPGHRFLSPSEARRREPALAAAGLEGAAVYYDAQVPLTERLCIEQIIDATAAGALALNHTRVTAIERDEHGAAVGVIAADTLNGRRWRLRAPVIINATGPWLDALLGLVEPAQRPVLRRTKGIHLAMPPVSQEAIVLFAGRDNRLFFIIPWLGFAYVGTTDTDFEGDPASAQADHDDIAYLLNEVRHIFPDAPWRPIYYTTAGVRALVRRDGISASAVSRKHRLIDHAASGCPGLISVAGGKLTAHRGIAEEAVNLAARRLGWPRPCLTRRRPLPGAIGYSAATTAQAREAGASLGLDAEQCDHLVSVYGAGYRAILARIAAQPALATRIESGAPDCLAQLHQAVEREGARTLTDALLRRTTLGLTVGQGLTGAPIAAAVLADLLGWDERRRAAEINDYQAAVAFLRAPVYSLPLGDELSGSPAGRSR